MKKNYHSCYDKLYFNCINSSFNDGELIQLTKNLTAHEVIVYTLLLSKCIEYSTEKGIISYSELQGMRNKRKNLDKSTAIAYDKAFNGLMKNDITYDVSKSKRRRKITYQKYSQPLLLIYDVKKEIGNNKVISFSLGPLGKTILESKMYSNLVPESFYHINFKNLLSFLTALYICRIIFIERHKRKKKEFITIMLDSIMRGTTKYTVSSDGMLVGNTSCLDYDGPNKLRLKKIIINYTEEVLKLLMKELKILDFKCVDNRMWKVYL